ncbi:MAG: glycyl-radical enzyme activating protein [Anaerolineaceae bacterium]|nr:glycyl-radical enzyme activating protein [Anaerolineaceae bacterium]
MTSTGAILHIQRLSTEDGPGIRSTVFFKGCPLRCTWCHNPESISPQVEVQWMENKCIACRTCLKVCPNHALTWTDRGVARDRSLCRVCGACADRCPANAHELLGQKIEVGPLVKELVKDQSFFETSGGGVTLSGGEPTLQPLFALKLLRELRSRGISTALDTCGLCAAETLACLAAESDLILYDLKLLDEQEHHHFTGASNQRILSNLRWLGQYLLDHPQKKLWIRTPLIPGATCNGVNIQAIGTWLAENLPGCIERWELCAFNNLCRDKYRRLDLDWAFVLDPLLARNELEQAGEWARCSGFDQGRIFVTGAARVEN